MTSPVSVHILVAGGLLAIAAGAPACTLPGDLADYAVATAYVQVEVTGDRATVGLTLRHAPGAECTAIDDDVAARANDVDLPLVSGGGTEPIRPSNGDLSCGAASFEGAIPARAETTVEVEDTSHAIVVRYLAEPVALVAEPIVATAGQVVTVGVMPEDAVAAYVSWEPGLPYAIPTDAEALGPGRAIELEVPGTDVVPPGRHTVAIDVHRAPAPLACTGAPSCEILVIHHQEIVVDVAP